MVLPSPEGGHRENKTAIKLALSRPLIFQRSLYPKPVLALPLPVSVSVCPRVCPCVNPELAGRKHHHTNKLTTKFGQKKLKLTLIKIPIVLGLIDLDIHGQN